VFDIKDEYFFLLKLKLFNCYNRMILKLYPKYNNNRAFDIKNEHVFLLKLKLFNCYNTMILKLNCYYNILILKIIFKK